MIDFCVCIEQLNEELILRGMTTPFVETFFIFSSDPSTRIYTIETPHKSEKGNYSKTKKTTLFVKFCPMCGLRMPEIPDPSTKGDIV